jgi:hypothetical protein
MTEKWNKRRRPKQYATPSKAAKILANFNRPDNLASTVGVRTLLFQSELDDNDVNTVNMALDILKRTTSNIDGLELPSLGQCSKGLSLPRFAGAVKRFVQVSICLDTGFAQRTCFLQQLMKCTGATAYRKIS